MKDALERSVTVFNKKSDGSYKATNVDGVQYIAKHSSLTLGGNFTLESGGDRIALFKIPTVGYFTPDEWDESTGFTVRGGDIVALGKIADGTYQRGRHDGSLDKVLAGYDWMRIDKTATRVNPGFSVANTSTPLAFANCIEAEGAAG